MASGNGRGTGGLWRRFVLLAPVLPAIAAGGCGGSEERTSNPRPPATVEVSVEIGDDRVSADPGKLGAGPIVLVASNQSSASHLLTIDGPRLRQSVGPINPQDTATLKVDVRPGEYTVGADGTAAVRPTKLTVGPERASAQNELLQP
jgi:hypothetical protein